MNKGRTALSMNDPVKQQQSIGKAKKMETQESCPSEITLNHQGDEPEPVVGLYQSSNDYVTSDKGDEPEPLAGLYQSYKDYANVELAPKSCRSSSKKRSGVPGHFPSLLYSMLSRAKKFQYNHICSWQPHGRSFLVHDRDKFVELVMPIYFRQTQFSSFQRQLNLYGFTRVSVRGPEFNSYFHECFLRGKPELCDLIQRSRANDEAVPKKFYNPEPDFYSMPFLPPEIDHAEEDGLHRAASIQGIAHPQQGTIKPDDLHLLLEPRPLPEPGNAFAFSSAKGHRQGSMTVATTPLKGKNLLEVYKALCTTSRFSGLSQASEYPGAICEGNGVLIPSRPIVNSKVGAQDTAPMYPLTQIPQTSFAAPPAPGVPPAPGLIPMQDPSSETSGEELFKRMFAEQMRESVAASDQDSKPAPRRQSGKRQRNVDQAVEEKATKRPSLEDKGIDSEDDDGTLLDMPIREIAYLGKFLQDIDLEAESDDEQAVEEAFANVEAYLRDL